MQFRTSSRRRIVSVALLLGLLIVALSALTASAATVVTPNNPDGWAPTDVRADATVGITTAQPRSGDGSLQFQTITVTPGQDKADFTKTWTDLSRTLGAVTKVAFEYYRDSSSTTGVNLSPVLRLLFYNDEAPPGLGPEDHYGYLIWEGTYNGINPAPVDSWQSEDVTGDYFWMRLVGGPNTAGGCEKTIQNFSVTLSDWITLTPQGIAGDCVAPDLDSDTLIYGINTGVGSGWGANFLGYVDNVEFFFGADEVSANFEPDPQCAAVCYADAVGGNDANGGTSPADAKKTIQAAIDAVDPGGEVRVLPGAYDETASGRFLFNATGPYQFGLFIQDDTKDGISILGVTAADVEIADPALTEAVITTNATNSFGYSGTFVEADDVTISGLEFGDNSPSNNKTIEVIGDNFTFKNSFMNVSDGGSLYFGDWRFDAGTTTSYMLAYTVDNNIFSDGSSVDVSSGAGYSGSVANKLITNNQFEFSLAMYAASGNVSWPNVSFNGDSTEIPWYTYPMTGATITGNTFTNNAPDGRHIRARGIADDSTFDWESYWNDNTYNKAVIVGPNLLSDVRAYTYSVPDGGGDPGWCPGPTCEFFDVRQIGAVIQVEIDHAVDGDTVLVNEGTYPESPDVDKSVTLVSDDGRDLTFIELQTATNYLHSLQISGADVTVDGFTIVGIDAACPTFASSNIYITTAPQDVEILNNRLQVGNTGACSNGDDGMGIITTYHTAFDTLSTLLVDNNLFEPLNSEASRAFYVNPGTDAFTFSNNTVTGQFNGTAITQAKNGLVEYNTVTGTGSSAGLATWGYPDASQGYGNTEFRYNEISQTANAITAFDTSNVNIHHNILDSNGNGARVVGLGDPFDLSTIHVNRNALTNNTTAGITNLVTDQGDVDGMCNWWGAADGPGPVGLGSGDNVSDYVDFTDWLSTDNLDGPCGAPPPVCPAEHEDVGYEMSMIVGHGMGDDRRLRTASRIYIPDYQEQTALYGQLAGKGPEYVAKFVRFFYPKGVQPPKIYTQISPAMDHGAIHWYGMDLDPARLDVTGGLKGSMRARWYLTATGRRLKAPRASIYYPTYETEEPYANVLALFDDSYTNFVADAVGYPSVNSQFVAIPETQAETDIMVKVAIVDVMKDNRSVDVKILIDNVVYYSETLTVPSDGPSLNILEVLLEDVPAGTDEIEIMLEAPVGGDSAAMVGATVNYACGPVEIPEP